MPDFAANLSLMFAELPFLERFAAAKRCGFDAVELSFPYEFPEHAVAALLRQHGMTLVALNLPAGANGQGIACDPDRVGEFRDGVRRAIDYAAAVNCRLLNCLVGAAADGCDDVTTRATLVENLRAASHRALVNSATILVEPVDTATLPGSALRGTAQAVALLDAVGARNVALCYDVCHMHAMGEVPAAMIARHRARIGHIQIAGAPDRGEPVGGALDYDELLGFIDGIGYRAWVGCEYRPRGGTEAGLAWLARYPVLTPRTPSRWGIPLHALRRPDAPGAAASESTNIRKA